MHILAVILIRTCHFSSICQLYFHLGNGLLENQSSSFNVYTSRFCILLFNNENMSLGKWLILLSHQSGVTVEDSQSANQSKPTTSRRAFQIILYPVGYNGVNCQLINATNLAPMPRSVFESLSCESLSFVFQMSYTFTELFGGALTVKLPPNAKDVRFDISLE